MGIRSWLQEREEFVAKYKWVLIGGAVVAGFILLLFGTKIYLLLNFLLGNDIVIKLDANTTSVNVVHGETATFAFDAGVITNPFCTALCNASWRAVTTGEIRDTQEFTLNPGRKHTQEYTVQPPDQGHGQEMYQYILECTSKPTAFCHTAGEPTRRTVLVTVEYDLSPEEHATKERAEGMMEIIMEDTAAYEAQAEATSALFDALSGVILLEEPFPGTIQPNTHETLWYGEEYGELERVLEEEAAKVSGALGTLVASHETYEDARTEYNSILQTAWAAREQLGGEFWNATAAEEMQTLVAVYDSLYNRIHSPSTIDEKRADLDAILALNTENVWETEERARLHTAIQFDIAEDLLCQLGGTCKTHPDLTTRAQEIPTIEELCERVEPNNATEIMDPINFYWNLSNTYAENIPEGLPYTELLQEILTPRNVTITWNGSNEDVRESILARMPDACDTSLVAITAEEQPTIPPVPVPPVNVTFSIAEPNGTCCVDGVCESCCEACNQEYLPVVFVHGHAFNKDTLAEYSLDAFNDLQRDLEGYIDAGTISLYTTLDTPEGDWGKPRAPVNLRVSYYLDIFEEPENYVVVQTKSENIDTYAIRLKELIDTVQYKTGKDQVILIAHSMGGLISRRYIQVFDATDVAGLIMIGTPNNGIVGSVAEYCSLIGEKLECRDMNADSLFMNKLNREPLPDIPIFNIVGGGCEMLRGDGDGIVLTENAMLEGAHNFVLNGTCETFQPLHTEILDTDQYPEVKWLVKGAIGAIDESSPLAASQ